MKQQILCRTAVPVALMALVACSQDAPLPNETDASDEDIVATDDTVTRPKDTQPDSADSHVETLAKTMPSTMLGRWHIDDLGRPPTTEDCDLSRDGTRDYDRLMTVREAGYGYFETGGRIMEVHARTDEMIDATFDTTYADEPTSARVKFTRRGDGPLAVQDESGQLETDLYRPCPE